jgi:hypothetical protein
MQLTTLLYRNGFLFATLIFGIFIWGFWPTFYGHPLSLKTNMHYVHATATTLWLVLLVIQPLLIRLNNRPLHKAVGKLSYVIFPLMIVSGLILLQHRQHALTEVDDWAYGFFYLIVQSVFVESLFFGLGLYHRKEPAIHGRWMLATIFPLLSAATDRLLGRMFYENSLTAMYTGWAVADLVLVALSIWDWRSHKKLNVFPIALAIMIVHHTDWYLVGQIPAWRHFADWFAAL